MIHKNKISTIFFDLFGVLLGVDQSVVVACFYSLLQDLLLRYVVQISKRFGHAMLRRGLEDAIFRPRVLDAERRRQAPALLEPLDARVAAVVALSAYLPARDKLRRRVADTALHRDGAAAVPPVLMCHGEADGTVQHAHGKASAKALKVLGVRTTFRSYAGLAHHVGKEEMADVALFLQKRLLVPGDERRDDGEL